MKLVATLIPPAILCSSPANAAVDILRCTSKDRPEITITIGERKLNRLVACIAGEFVVDMTPCAPNHGYGLSYPTGSASLSKIVDRWQDYGDHFGGVASFNANPAQMSFTGGWMGSDGMTTNYTFVIDRTTGKADLEATDQSTTDEKKYTAKYVCAKMKQKF